ncbi:penicillin-binding protein 1C [Halochromatium glycolicum]|uniref:penicillin-binding protein 1C n=1 Tax=Halochromatium glycolicum TaxID=85075 RepID=UPI0030B81845
MAWITIGLIALAISAIGAWLLVEAVLTSAEPVSLEIARSPVVLDRNGRLLRAFTVADGRWRLPVTQADVDPLYLQMLIGYEDQRFFVHPGVDARALVRAAWQMLRHRRIVSGGSTLTMQVVRLRLGLATGSFDDKWRQLIGALALERDVEKGRVLDAYLNLAPFGGNLEGVRAAALAWFGREPARLTPAQAALLVALPQAPEQRRPDRFPEAARRGRDRVLARAEALGLIDADAAAAARREPIPTERRPFPLLAPHLTRRLVASAPVASSASAVADEHRLTLNAELQQRLETLAAERAARLPDAVSVALLAADYRSGEVLASVGSADLLARERDGFVDMTRAPRSPGSTLKPLIYGLAFELGLAHPESLIEDRPSAFGGYVPENFDRGFQGTVTVRSALQQSLNVPAVTLLEHVGPARLLARLRRAGAQPELPAVASAPAGLAIGLGGLGLTLKELVALYAAIANGGQSVHLRERLVAQDDAAAQRRDAADRPANPVLEERAAWYLGSILSGAGRLDQRSDGIAIKTGTSYGYRDAWALGYDGAHVVGVWVGRPDGAAVPGLTGGNAAVPILRNAFARIGKQVPLPGPPNGVLFASTAQLPRPLQRAADETAESGREGPAIAFPPDGARIDLVGGSAGSNVQALVLKVRNGRPPFLWLANGVPVAREPYARVARWQPDGTGFATIAVVDADGRSSHVSVELR